MQLAIYCFIVLVALGAADPKPQSISTSLEPVQKFGKKLTTPELTLYLTGDVIKALQNAKSSKNFVPSGESREQKTQINEESYNQGRQIINSEQSQLSIAENSQKKSGGFVSRFFLPKDKDVSENQEQNNLAKFYLESLKMQKELYTQLQKSQQNNLNKEEGKTQTNANSVPYIPASYKNQEEILLHEQLQQQWNRILEHNRAQLQGLSVIKEQNGKQSQIEKNNILQQKPKIESQQDIRTMEQQSSRTKNQKSEVEREIENILRSHQAYNIATSMSPEQKNNQSPPILIHKEVRITKHQPVPIYKRVEVPVPRPVLVPIPEPYAVKIPQPYPVPLDIVKHIPVPVIRNY